MLIDKDLYLKNRVKVQISLCMKLAIEYCNPPSSRVKNDFRRLDAHIS